MNTNSILFMLKLYKGDSPAWNDLLGAHVELMLNTINEPKIRADMLLEVLSSPEAH